MRISVTMAEPRECPLQFPKLPCTDQSRPQYTAGTYCNLDNYTAYPVVVAYCIFTIGLGLGLLSFTRTSRPGQRLIILGKITILVFDAVISR